MSAAELMQAVLDQHWPVEKPSACTDEQGHCWHANGRSVTNGIARDGKDEGQCCHCGALYWRQWVIVTRPLEGHGPHVTQRVCAYVDEMDSQPVTSR